MRGLAKQFGRWVLGAAAFGVLWCAGGCHGPAAPPPAYVPVKSYPPLLQSNGTLNHQNYFMPAGFYNPATNYIVQEGDLQRGGRVTRVWIYRPRPLPTWSVPCVLIAPAGSHLFDGMALGEGDRLEHMSYVRAGMVVVAYELDGAIPNGQRPSDDALVRAAGEFMAAGAGIRNAQDALGYALATVPEIDPKRIYAAGHSSAATLALQLAQHDPRIAAVAAYAPCTDTEKRMGSAVGEFDARIKGYRDFVRSYSPLRNAAQLRCPVFLFHAVDDDNVLVAESDAFVAAVRKTNPNVTYDRYPTGGHYEGMRTEGIPQAISWMKQLPDIRSWRRANVEIRM